MTWIVQHCRPYWCNAGVAYWFKIQSRHGCAHMRIYYNLWQQTLANACARGSEDRRCDTTFDIIKGYAIIPLHRYTSIENQVPQ